MPGKTIFSGRSKIFGSSNVLIASLKDIQRQPFQGLGNPEPLKHNWQGFWSRRIDLEHRLVYQIREDSLFIAQCRYHY